MIIVKVHGILRSLLETNKEDIKSTYKSSFKKGQNEAYSLYFPFKKTFIFKDLLDELSIPRDYISCISINGKGYIKKIGFFDIVISDGDTLEIYPLLAAG